MLLVVEAKSFCDYCLNFKELKRWLVIKWYMLVTVILMRR